MNMKTYDYILFDLDGTLTDPGLGITNSVMYALKKFNIDVNDRTDLYKFIGPPLKGSFREFYGFTADPLPAVLSPPLSSNLPSSIPSHQTSSQVKDIHRRIVDRAHTCFRQP